MTSVPASALRARVACAALFVALVAFQFGDLARVPMILWDESRLAVNAVEMALSGNWLTTTYGFAPDLWNTKPPLAIWLMAAAMKLFGLKLWALRLPSALAAVTTVVLVTDFTRRVAGSLGAGLAAGLLLAASSGFYGYHAGQTGDYDALLTLLTTAYGITLFALIEAPRPRPGLAALAGGLVGLAMLTKGVAGLIPGIGIAGFALGFAGARLRVKLADYAIVLAVALAIGAAFYWLRAGHDAAYLHAVATNELGGRFGKVLEGHVGKPWSYFTNIMAAVAPGMIWPAFAGAGAIVFGAAAPWLLKGPARRAALFAICASAGILIVYTSAATKIAWYIEPVLPYLAVLLALTGFGRWQIARRDGIGGSRLLPALMVAGLVVVAAQAVISRYVIPPVPAQRPRAFDALLAAAAATNAWPLAVYDHGYPNDAGFVDYAPTLRFYALVAGAAGHAVRQVTTPGDAQAARYLGSCDPATRAAAAGLGPVVWQGGGCVLVAPRLPA